MRYPSITHHGAVTGVTASCHQLQGDGKHALFVDCGLFQGTETSPERRVGVGRPAGALHAPILSAPKASYKADTLVIGTYGERLHEDRKCLEKVLEHALTNQGTILISVFSIVRTQELLYEPGRHPSPGLKSLGAEGARGNQLFGSRSGYVELDGLRYDIRVQYILWMAARFMQTRMAHSVS